MAFPASRDRGLEMKGARLVTGRKCLNTESCLLAMRRARVIMRLVGGRRKPAAKASP
jgi:hypothetical protein